MAIQIQGGEIAPNVIVGSVDFFCEHKATFTILRVSAHPKIRITNAWVMLTEVPDAAGTTYTFQLFNAGVAMSNILTFTQGVDTKGTVLGFTLIAGMDVILESSAITCTTAGTTVTLGHGVMFINFENVN